MGVTLQDSDILNLIRTGSTEDKVRVTGEISTKYLKELYSEDELSIVEDIFRILTKDAEAKVRATLSEALKLSKILPHDIALRLARDIEEVSLPMIEFSQVLNDDDLIEIICTDNVQKALAVSRRNSLNDKVKGKLLETNNNEVIGNVIANDNFPKNPEDFIKFVHELSENPEAVKNLVRGISLPAKISEKLMKEVAGQIVEQVKHKYDIAPEKLSQIASHTVEINTIAGVQTHTTSEEIDGLVNHLHNFGRLTNSLILSSLCMGRRRFFLAALAKRAGVPKKNVIILINKGGKDGLNSLLKKAGMPEKLYGAIELVLKLSLEIKGRDKNIEPQEFGRWMTEKLQFFAERTKVEYISYMMAITKQSMSRDPLVEYR